MVVDAGAGGASLDQMMYDEAYGKALDDGISLLGGGFGSRDNLAALDISLASGGLHAPSPRAARAPPTRALEPDPELEPARGHPFIHADHRRHVIAPVPALASVPNRPARLPRATTTTLLGEFALADLDRWSSRELRRRFCDVLDAPPPVERMEDTSWLRARLAPHAVDAAREGSGSGFAGRGSDRARSSGTASSSDARGDATDDDEDDDARVRHRRAFAAASEEATRRTRGIGDARSPSPCIGSAGANGGDVPANFARASDIVAEFAPAPASMLAVPGRVPSGEEILASVRRRTPSATESWATTAAAASAALSSAIRKSELAIEARALGKRAAGRASKAVSRAARAAERAEAIKTGRQKPVPRSRVPAAVIRRLSLTGSTDVVPKNPPRSNASESASGSTGKRRRGSEADADDSREVCIDPAMREGSGAGFGKKGKRDETRAEAGPSGTAKKTTARHANANANASAPSPPPASPPRPPRPRMDLAGDPAARERAALWKRASSLDACHVCGEGAPDHWREDDEIIFCDGCDVQVHLSCYGLTKVPEGEWRCVGCEDGVDAGEADEGEFGVCALCPQPGGALARLDPPSAWDVAWESPGTHAHLACADCLPEVFVIKDAPGREGKPPLIDMSFVKAARINLRCSLCGQEGACTQCAMRKCFASFHPLCARAAGFACERHAQDGRPVMFCKTHSGDRWAEGRRVAAGKPAKLPAADAARAGSNPDVDDKGKNKGEGARARSTPPEDGPGDDKERGNAGVSDRQRRVADRVAAAARLWDGFAPFLRSTRDRTRLGKASRKMLASSSLDENERARLASLDDEAGAAEFARIVASRDAEVDNALARVATAAAGAPVAAPSPWPALRRGQRETVRWLAARHLAGLGGVVANGVGAGKRLATLAHLLHLRDGLGLRGPHLLACPRENAATWIADLNRWCPKLRAVSLASPEDERTSAKAAALRAGGIDVVIVPTDALIESSAALVAKEKAEKEMKAEKEAKEVKAEEEEKDAAAVNTRTDPDAGASGPDRGSLEASQEIGQDAQILLRSSLAGQGGRERRRSPRRRASHVLPLSHRGRGRRRGGDAPRARRGVARASRRLFPRRRRRRRVTPPRHRRRRRRAKPSRRARVGSPRTVRRRGRRRRHRRERARPRGAPRRRRVAAAPATTTNALLRSFLRVDDDAENDAENDADSAPTHETIVRVRVAERASPACDASARVAALSATLPRLRATRRRMLVVATSQSTLDAASAALGDARVAHVRLDVASRGARLHAAARVSRRRVASFDVASASRVGVRDGRRRESRERCGERRGRRRVSRRVRGRTRGGGRDASSDARGEGSEPSPRDDSRRGGGRGRHLENAGNVFARGDADERRARDARGRERRGTPRVVRGGCHGRRRRRRRRV